MNFQIPQFLSTYMYKNKSVPLEKAYILAMGWEESHLSMFKNLEAYGEGLGVRGLREGRKTS